MSAAKTLAAPTWHLPRQTAFAAPGVDSVTGVSSFAFQGTNAHAVLQQTAVPAAATSMHATSFARTRVWVAPPAHILLQSVAGGTASHGLRTARTSQRQTLAFDTALSQPRLSFLWQHMVLGKMLLPAATFLEAATATMRALLNSNDLNNGSLRDAVFATPLALPPPSTDAKLRCTVHVAAGTLDLSSLVAASQHQRLHFSAIAATLAASTCQQRAGTPVPTFGALLFRQDTGQPSSSLRLALGAIASPPWASDLGLSVHPAVSEAALHIGMVPGSRGSGGGLRVAAKIRTTYVPAPLSDATIWAVSAAGRGTGWQQLLGGTGGNVANSMAGVETRRLLASRPTTLTPRMPHSPRTPLTPFTPYSPHTPYYLASPMGDGHRGSAHRHTSYALSAVAEDVEYDSTSNAGAATARMDAASLQALVSEAVEGVLGSAIGPDQPLMAAGLDSLGATELQQNLVRRERCSVALLLHCLVPGIKMH